mmetsp:Transcript_48841/g.95797  ORF Transcript_48841/g.95797 Transcript_48841/m.95797 type:complete len:362 (+) Transcript_48841:79-1164(+)
MAEEIPYLGAPISLISTANIRYEGILYTIDAKEATVSLQNVKCYGTEGRSETGVEVPASDQVFEFIVFSGKDIKDLNVLQKPTEEKPPEDPAIMFASSAATPPPVAQDPWAAGPAGGWGVPPGGDPFGNNAYPGASVAAPPAGGSDNNKSPGKQKKNTDGPLPGTGGFLKTNRRARGRGNNANAEVSAEAGEQKTTGDFDFEAGLKAFDKEAMIRQMKAAKEKREAGENAAEGEGDDEDQTADLGIDLGSLEIGSKYDKNTSFFDSISTDRDTRDRQATARMDNQNTDTFGDGAQGYRSQHSYRRGGRYNNNRSDPDSYGNYSQNRQGGGRGGRRGGRRGRGRGRGGGGNSNGNWRNNGGN